MHLLAIGGSDGGISAALRAREIDPGTDVTVMLADSYPNFWVFRHTCGCQGETSCGKALCGGAGWVPAGV